MIVSPAQIQRLGPQTHGPIHVQAGERRDAALHLLQFGEVHWCLSDLTELQRPQTFDAPGERVFLWVGPGAPAASWPLRAEALRALAPGQLGAGRAEERSRLNLPRGELTLSVTEAPLRSKRVLAACECAARAGAGEYLDVNQGEAQLALSDLLARYPEALREVVARGNPSRLRAECERVSGQLSALGTLARTLLRELDRRESAARPGQA